MRSVGRANALQLNLGVAAMQTGLSSLVVYRIKSMVPLYVREAAKHYVMVDFVSAQCRAHALWCVVICCRRIRRRAAWIIIIIIKHLGVVILCRVLRYATIYTLLLKTSSRV